jgi:dihydrofolate synthase/folylpolyglutamate synthase
LYFTSYKRSRRSATQADLEAALQASDPNRSYLYASSVAEAFRAVAATATADDFICVTGSVFLAGEFLSFWTDQLSAPHASA